MQNYNNTGEQEKQTDLGRYGITAGKRFTEKRRKLLNPVAIENINAPRRKPAQRLRFVYWIVAPNNDSEKKFRDFVYAK